MTSKEALERICLHCEHYHQGMCFRAIAGCEEWHKLEKDLKVLETLRKNIAYVDIVKNQKATLEIVIRVKEEDRPKIKGWLDDRK